MGGAVRSGGAARASNFAASDIFRSRPLAQCYNITYVAASMFETLLAPIRHRLDRIGIALSGLCAVHCVATVVLVSWLGLGGTFLASPEIHRIGLTLAVAIASVTIGWSALQHRAVVPLGIAVVGLTFMASGLVVPHGPLEALLTVIGVALVSTGHILNLRRCHC